MHTLIKTGENQYAVVVGKIEYHAGREYPWLGRHGCLGQYFRTQQQAEQFAATGKANSTIL